MIELLIAEENDESFKIVGTQQIDKPVVDSSKSLLKASTKTVEIVKASLSEGKVVYVPKSITNNEVVPSDLVIAESDNPLVIAKNIAKSDITNLINQNVFGISIIDAMDYLNCMMKLMSVGIFITDENREDKYFEIIETAQTTEEPAPIGPESTFEEEQQYIEQKRKYDQAQTNLATLEKYLNAYDKLSKIKFINDLLNTSKDRVDNSKTTEEVFDAVKEYNEKLDKFLFSEPCST